MPTTSVFEDMCDLMIERRPQAATVSSRAEFPRAVGRGGSMRRVWYGFLSARVHGEREWWLRLHAPTTMRDFEAVLVNS